jgi:tRNA 2-selenouridine synthase
MLIGQVAIPDAFYTIERDASLFFRRSSGGKNKTPCYHLQSLSHDKLADAISRITKRLGYDNAKFAGRA